MFDIDTDISKVKNELNKIFDRYKDNGYFENIEATSIKALIYDNTIKFIPIEVSNEVEELLNILATLEETKTQNYAKIRK